MDSTQSSRLMLSASGIRGIVGDSLTPTVALDIGQAFGTYLGKGTVIVAGDTRPSYETFKAAVIAGLTATGINIIQ